MNIDSYRLRRLQLNQESKSYRELCWNCRQPNTGCYCSLIKRFDPKIKFVILIHHVEERRRIATGRMSHLCLENSELIVGQDYSLNDRVNDILDDTTLSPVILYPGRNATDITTGQDTPSNSLIFKPGKTPVVFVIDGTWATARKMIRQSQNLLYLPKICFTPKAPSQFRVRKQPRKECFSTIEAIHQTIQILGPTVGYSVESKQHENLLKVFNVLVETQIRFLQESFDNPKSSSYRRPKRRVV